MIDNYKIFKSKDFIELSWSSISYSDFSRITTGFFKNFNNLDFIIADKSIMIFDPEFDLTRINASFKSSSELENICHELIIDFKGEDLTSVCSILNMTEDSFIKRYTEQEHYVCFNGFIAGFSYIACDDNFFQVPRKKKAEFVKKGAVAIANGMTGIYPQDCPGGWHVIGYTSFVNLDLSIATFMKFNPGDRIKFVPNG